VNKISHIRSKHGFLAFSRRSRGYYGEVGSLEMTKKRKLANEGCLKKQSRKHENRFGRLTRLTRLKPVEAG
jgi:hypothetical protein